MLDAASTGALINAESISKAFQAGDEIVYALRDVSFGIGKGEFVALLGPSGCGKTTLMMILVGLINADAGEVRIEGHHVRAPFTDVGIVFQSPELLEWRTALENILHRDSPLAGSQLHNPRQRAAGSGRTRRFRGQVSVRAVRRHEAACRALPRSGSRSRDIAHGRAVRGARCSDA